MHCWRKTNLQSWPREYQSALKNTGMIQMTQMRLRSWLKPRWRQFAFKYFEMTVLFRFRNHVNRISFSFVSVCLSLSLSLYTQKSKTLTRKDPAEEFIAKYSYSPPSRSVQESPRKTVVALKQEIKDLKEENTKLRELLIQGITSLILQLDN